MNSQMPYFPNDNQSMNTNFNHNLGNNFNPNMGNNFFNMMFERLNNRLNRMERQIRIIENRLNRLESVNPTFLNNDDSASDNNMYIL